MGMFDNYYQNQNPMGGYYYNPQAVPQQKIPNVLTEEEIKELRQTQDSFRLNLTTRETMQAACNHRLPDGTSDSLVFDPTTGTARCTICGYEFSPIDENTSIEEINDDVKRITNILQTIKLMYIDLPADASRSFFQIIPLIEKVPKLFEFAAKNFNKHEFNSWQYNNGSVGAMTMLNNIQAMFNPGFGGFGQPMYGQPVQQPMMNPMQQPMYGQPVQPQPMMNPQAPMQPMQQPAGAGVVPGVNPFGYPGASQVQQPVVNQGYAYQPGQPNPVSATVSAPEAPAPAAQETATVQQSVTV